MSDDINFEQQDKENEEQVGELIDTFTVLETQEKNITPIEKEMDLKKSLSNFVVDFLDRIAKHKDIEDVLKEALIERLPDASIEEITNILNIVMTKTNSAIEKIMIPFSQKGDKGDTTNNFLFDMQHKEPVEEKILNDENMTPETIKGLYDLAQMMNAITNNQPKK